MPLNQHLKLSTRDSTLLPVLTQEKQLWEHTVMSDVEKASSQLLTISYSVTSIKAASLNKPKDASWCKAKLLSNRNWERQARSINRFKID